MGGTQAQPLRRRYRCLRNARYWCRAWSLSLAWQVYSQLLANAGSVIAQRNICTYIPVSCVAIAPSALLHSVPPQASLPRGLKGSRQAEQCEALSNSLFVRHPRQYVQWWVQHCHSPRDRYLKWKVANGFLSIGTHVYISRPTCAFCGLDKLCIWLAVPISDFSVDVHTLLDAIVQLLWALFPGSL